MQCVLLNMMPCVLPNRILKKCPSEHFDQSIAPISPKTQKRAKIFFATPIYLYFFLRVFFSFFRMDGCLDCWDILYQQRAPLLSVKVSDEPLHTLKVHEGGCLVATGCDGGNVALLELAEGLASAHRNDKTSVTAVSCLLWRMEE